MVTALIVVLAACSEPAASAPSSASPPPATPAATTAPPPTTVTGAVPVAPFQAVTEIETEDNVIGLAGAAAGYALLQSQRLIRFSADGKGWQRVVLPFKASTSSIGTPLDAFANTIVSNGSSFLVLGAYQHEPCVAQQGDGGPPPCKTSPLSWVSSDGLHWASSLEFALPTKDDGKPELGEFIGAWWTGIAWIAAAQLRDSPVYEGNTLLRSTDGRHWTRLPALPHLAEIPANQLPVDHGGVSTSATSSVVWQVWYSGQTEVTTLSRLDNEQTWSVIGDFRVENGRPSLGVGAGPAPEFALLAGIVYSGPATPTFWPLQEDPIQAVPLLLPAEGSQPRFVSLDRHAGAYVAAILIELDGLASPGVWASTDGFRWTQVGGEAINQEIGNLAMAEGPAGLLLVGQKPESGAYVWVSG
jgi:hypothetical protein